MPNGKRGEQKTLFNQRSPMDARFFRKAKRVNRAIEITDMEAVIPAVKDSPEIRVPLPNRRPKTFEEREAAIQARNAEITTLEQQIEDERKRLLELVKSYRAIGSGAADVVVQNLKIKNLMEQRSALARPEVWIEEISGLSAVDIFESKRDIRKLGGPVYQVKRRVEPISSLYVDLGQAAAQATVAAESAEAAEAASVMAAEAAATQATLQKQIKATEIKAAPTTQQKATTGAIVGQRRTIKVRNPTGTAPPS